MCEQPENPQIDNANPEITKDLDNICTPTGKALTQFLHRKRNGAKLSDILLHLKREFQDTKIDPLTRNLATCLEAGTNYGFLERKGSRFCVSRVRQQRDADEVSARVEERKDALDTRSQPSDRCRRRRRRRRRRC